MPFLARWGARRSSPRARRSRSPSGGGSGAPRQTGQLGCVHPAPLDGGAEVGVDAPADEAEAADEADAADAEADADPETEGFRVGVTGGGAAGEGLATPGSEIHVTPTFSDQQLGVCVGAVGNPARPQSVLVQLRIQRRISTQPKGGWLLFFPRSRNMAEIS